MWDPSKWTETYVEWNPSWSLSRNIPMGDKLGLNLAYNGGFHFTTTDSADSGNPANSGNYAGSLNRTNTGDKLDSGLSATLMYSITEKFLISPNIRFTRYIYTQPQPSGVTRRDRSLNPGINFMWNPSPRWSIRWSLSSEFKHSNDANSPNYSKFDAATGISLTLKF